MINKKLQISVAMNRESAIETATALGPQFSAYGINVNDAEGYLDEEATDNNWYVERDDSIVSDRFFGLTFDEILAKQKKL